jgi:predicted TIM-barrel fold metal-dependent hydrolase
VTRYNITIAHITPAVVGLAPNHPTYFPIYAKCAELGVTLRVNIAMPGPSHRAALQEPILLDEVLLTFPDLNLVGAHLGHPWIDQVIALLRKYEHFSLMTSGWAPSRWTDTSYRRKSMSNRKKTTLRGRASKFPPEFRREAVAMVLDVGSPLRWAFPRRVDRGL